VGMCVFISVTHRAASI